MIMGSSIPNAPYSQASPYANYPVAWYGGPVPSMPSGPACKTQPSWRMPRLTPGLGDCMSYYDILNSIGGGSQNCDPRDSACVMAGTQRANAAEDAMLSSSCIPPGTPISFTPNTSQAALDAYMANQPVQPSVNVGTGVVTEKPAGGVVVSGTPSAPPPYAPPPKNVVATGSGSGSGNGSGGSGSGGTGGNGTGSSNFLQTWIDDLTSGTDIITGLPNWALIVGAVAGVVILAQASGGRR